MASTKRSPPSPASRGNGDIPSIIDLQQVLDTPAEMTAEQRSEALLGRGYFPKELPPPFQTELFAAKAASLRLKWAELHAAMPKKDRDNHPVPSHPVLFDMARKGHARRTLAIPNPVSQFYLTEELSSHWDAISQLINSSSLSITRCDISPEGRAISLPALSGLADKRVILHAPLGAILQTDVLSFYHAIYTHAIPWALHGKSAAKANRSIRDPKMFGNRIDFLLRSCQDGQTIGVPVGPDTSRIISEMLLCAVEAKMPQKALKLITEGFRYIDDFFLCFDSLADAEAVLAALREACLQFDLQLNAAKTQTMSALAFNEASWPSDISAIQIAPIGKMQRRSLLRFFSAVVRLSKDLPDESIATYAVRMTTKTMIEKDNWDLYEAFLLRMARENGNCIDSVVKILCTYAAIGYPFSRSVVRFVERIIVDHAPYNHHFEVAWALWLAHSLNLKLSREASGLVARMENDVCAILTLHLRSRRLLSGRGKALEWVGPDTEVDVRGSHWLLIYEAGTRPGWKVEGAAAAVARNHFFSAMVSAGVSFYVPRTFNRPVKIPGIEFSLREALGTRKRAILLGAVFVEKGKSSDELDLEELGGNYDESFALNQYFDGSADEEDDGKIE